MSDYLETFFYSNNAFIKPTTLPLVRCTDEMLCCKMGCSVEPVVPLTTVIVILTVNFLHIHFLRLHSFQCRNMVRVYCF